MTEKSSHPKLVLTSSYQDKVGIHVRNYRNIPFCDNLIKNIKSGFGVFLLPQKPKELKPREHLLIFIPFCVSLMIKFKILIPF